MPAGGTATGAGSGPQVAISYTLAPVSQATVMVCLASAHVRGDSSVGVFFQVSTAEWNAGVSNQSSELYHSTPAMYVAGYGTMCQLSDLVTYGGDPRKYTDTHTKVDGLGNVSVADEEPAYEYYVPAG